MANFTDRDDVQLLHGNNSIIAVNHSNHVDEPSCTEHNSSTAMGKNVCNGGYRNMKILPSIPSTDSDVDTTITVDTVICTDNPNYEAPNANSSQVKENNFNQFRSRPFLKNIAIEMSSSSDSDDTVSLEQLFSKSCDYQDESENNHSRGPTVSRSLSEDILIKPAAYNRRVSVMSTKGKLLGCPRVMPGEKIKRSRSVAVQTPSKLPVIEDQSSIEGKKKRKFTAEQKWIAFCLCLVDFTSFLSMSVIAPFFPREAAQKGMREAVSGMVFSIYALVVMVSSPIFGKLIPTVGAKYMFLSGVLFSGGCNILFGLLDKVNGETEFMVLCFVVRSFEALGTAAFTTASCTILIDEFPDDIGTVFGFTETCLGIGMSLGPAIGGALYSVGGFGLPFFTLGGFVMMTAPVCWYILRSMEDPEVDVNSTVSYKKLLSMPHVIVVCVILVVSSQAQGFIDPTLEPHMRQYNLTPGIIGLLFLLLSGAYAISSPIVGWISGKCHSKYPVMIVGLSLVTVSLLLIGPSELLPFSGSVWLSSLALVLLGLSFAAAYVPTFESMFIAAMNGGLDDDINTYSIVSGLWNCMYSLGEVTGPSLGGILSDFFTFPQASTLMAFCTAAAFVIAIIAWVNPCLCFGPLGLVEMDDDEDEDDDETSQILSNSLPTREKTPLVTSGCDYGSLWPNNETNSKTNPIV